MHITQKTNYLTMAHDLFISAWITAIITILLTPSLGKRSDLHNTLRVDTPKEVGVCGYTTNTDTSLPSPRLVSLQHYNDFISFKEKMGYRESRNNYFITNPSLVFPDQIFSITPPYKKMFSIQVLHITSGSYSMRLIPLQESTLQEYT